jgi:hypothetical protein
MAIQYTLPLEAYDGVDWRVNIYSDSFSGLITTVKGSENQPVVLEYSGDVDDHFGVFIKSTLTVNMLYENNIDVNQLQNSADREYRIEIQRKNELKWVGYLISEDIEQPLRSDAYTVKVTAVCGLTMLPDMDYNHNNLPGVDGNGSRVPMNYIRQVLFGQNNLNVMIPIRWTNNIRNKVYEGQDVFIGSVIWSPRGEGFNSVDVNSGLALPKKNSYILEGILKSMQCRIYQSNGRWTIRRIPDYYSGVFRYTQIPGNLGKIVPLSASEVIAKKIGAGGYPFINEKDLLTNAAGIKSCKVTYNADVRDNIIPNGNQDLTSLGSVIYWGFTDTTDTIVSTNNGSLDGRSGSSSEIWNFSPTTQYFTMLSEGSTLRTGGLPVDTKKLLKIVNFSFYFSPKNGFPYDPTTGIIDFSSNPLQLQIVMNIGANQLFLNEFGFWVNDINAYISPAVEGLKVDDIARVAFDKFQGVKLPEPTFFPVSGDTCDIKIIFLVKSGQKYVVDNISITIENSDDVYVNTINNSKNTKEDTRELEISSSFGGYMVSNFMSNWDKSDLECFFTDGDKYTGTLTGMTADVISRCKYKASKIYNGSINVRGQDWSFDEIYTIETLSDRRFMPINATYDIQKCEVDLVAIETRNDDISRTEKTYGSNDKQLSN